MSDKQVTAMGRDELLAEIERLNRILKESEQRLHGIWEDVTDDEWPEKMHLADRIRGLAKRVNSKINDLEEDHRDQMIRMCQE